MLGLKYFLSLKSSVVACWIISLLWHEPTTTKSSKCTMCPQVDFHAMAIELRTSRLWDFDTHPYLLLLDCPSVPTSIHISNHQVDCNLEGNWTSFEVVIYPRGILMKLWSREKPLWRSHKWRFWRKEVGCPVKSSQISLLIQAHSLENI